MKSLRQVLGRELGFSTTAYSLNHRAVSPATQLDNLDALLIFCIRVTFFFFKKKILVLCTLVLKGRSAEP